MTHVFALLFAAVSLLHLYACFTCRFPLRAATKPLIMPLLAALYFVSAETPHPLVIAALLLGTVGDAFLLSEKHRFIIIGGMAFGLGHICYIAALFLYAGAARAQLFAAVLIALVYALAAVFGFFKLRGSLPQKLRGSIFAYMLLLCAMSASCALAFSVHPSAERALFLLGGVLFLASDALLARLLFMQGKKRGNFPVMATYIAAQTLIVAGFLAVRL